MFPDVAADSASSESLSFACLVSTQQDQKQSSRVEKADLEFEFSRSNAGTPNNNSTDKSATKCASLHQASKQIPLVSFLQVPGNRTETDMKKQTNHQSTKQVSQVKRRTHEKHSAREKSFSQKLFSFATPCRDCRASQPVPSIKQHTLQWGRIRNSRLHFSSAPQFFQLSSWFAYGFSVDLSQQIRKCHHISIIQHSLKGGLLLKSMNSEHFISQIFKIL